MVMRLVQSQFVLCDLSRLTKMHFKLGQMTWNMKGYLHFINWFVKGQKGEKEKDHARRKWRLTKLVGLFCEAGMQEKFSMALRWGQGPSVVPHTVNRICSSLSVTKALENGYLCCYVLKVLTFCSALLKGRCTRYSMVLVMGSSEHGHDYCWKLSAELSKKPNDFSILLSVADKEGFRIFITSFLLETEFCLLIARSGSAEVRKSSSNRALICEITLLCLSVSGEKGTTDGRGRRSLISFWLLPAFFHLPLGQKCPAPLWSVIPPTLLLAPSCD